MGKTVIAEKECNICKVADDAAKTGFPTFKSVSVIVDLLTTLIVTFSQFIWTVDQELNDLSVMIDRHSKREMTGHG
jgi:hypothetical protein